MDILYEGKGEYPMPDVDGFRAWMRDHKKRALTNKLMDEHEAVSKFVRDGDYIAYDFCLPVRGPTSLMREVIRQRKKDLWVCTKFTYATSTFLLAGGCVSKIDTGFIGLGKTLYKAVEEGRVKVSEWTNGTLTLRLLAGCMGIPFLPTRTLLGSDTLKYSGAKVISDPFTKEPICLVPALNPDVGIVHVNQCDVYGNARIFGPSCAPIETAMASKKVIISTEELIDHEEIRRSPQKNTIPYYFVDAVVLAPFGSYPGDVPGLYRSDPEHMKEFFSSIEDEEKMTTYMEKYVYSASSHEEFLEKRVGIKKLLQMKEDEKIKEGYYL